MKLGSWLSIVAVLTCGFSAIAETTEDYAAQADLVACWDGVENAGTSGQHVDSLPDNEWRDTIGNVPFVMHGITVEKNCVVLGDTTSSYGELSVTGNANPFNSSATMGTLEIVYRAGTTSTENQMLLQGNTTAGIAIGTYSSTAQFICWTGANKNYFRRPLGSSWSSGTNTIAVTYASSNPQGLYFNSVSGDLAGNSQNWSNPNSSIFLGKRNNNTMSFAGSIYAVRLYRRALTAVEIAHNREIDEKRFLLGRVCNEGLQITSTSQVCNPSSPAYGTYEELSDGEEMTVTITDPEVQTVRSDAVCRGWKFYRRNQAKEWVLEDEGASLTYTYRHTAGALAKLEWQWEETAVYGTRRYVQDGLVACWDGAENGGVSGEHLSELSEWKDTLNDVAFALQGDITVTADGLNFTGQVADNDATDRGEITDASTTFTRCRSGTLEIVLTPSQGAVSGTGTPLALCGSKDSGMAVGFYKVNNQDSYYLITTYGSTSSPTLPYTADDWASPYQTVSVRYNNWLFVHDCGYSFAA